MIELDRETSNLLELSSWFVAVCCLLSLALPSLSLARSLGVVRRNFARLGSPCVKRRTPDLPVVLFRMDGPRSILAEPDEYNLKEKRTIVEKT
jgi:hypothetical protein